MPNSVDHQDAVVSALVERGARLAREYGTARKGTRTAILRDLAAVIAHLRRGFKTEDGFTDWAGRSREHRDAVALIYNQAGLSRDESEAMQAALRYHIGNVIREIAPDDELQELGLMPSSPRARIKSRAARTVALARLGGAQAGTGNPRADIVRMIMGAEVVISRVDALDLADLEPDTAEAVANTLDALVEHANKLLNELRHPAH